MCGSRPFRCGADMIVPAWFLWTMVAMCWLGAVSTILLIGEERKPYGKGQAIANLVQALAATVLVLIWGGYL